MPRSDAEQERARLLAATWRIVGRSGLSGVKLENVLAASGLSTRAFYRCFSDKDDLVSALAGEYYDLLVIRSKQAFADADDPVDGFRIWVELMLDIDGDLAHARAGQALTRHWTEIRLAHPDAVAALIARLHDVLVEPLRELRRSGSVHLRPRADAAAILLLTGSVLEQRLMSLPPMSLEDARAIVWPFVHRSLTLRVPRN